VTLHRPPRLKFLLGIAVMLGISIAAGAPSKAASGPLDSDALESTPLNPLNSAGGYGKFDQSTATSSAMQIGRVVLALGGVIGLIVVLRVFAKRVIPGVTAARASSSVKILGRCPVSARQNLLVVQFGKRLVLVGDGGTNLNPLCEITDPQEVADILAQARDESISVAQRFESMFGRARKDFDEDPEPTSADPFSDSRDISSQDDPALSDTRKELSDLQEKVRDVARQIGRA